MPRGSTQARNHPRKGSAIKVEPIRELSAIKDIKDYLIDKGQWRNYCLFTVGINTAYRASELLSLKVGQVVDLQPGDVLQIKERKTRKYRPVTLNHAAWVALSDWLAKHPKKDDPNAPVFLSARTRHAIQVPTLCRLVKTWCGATGLHGHYGSHTLRKTWGYQERKILDAPMPLLMRAFGHSSEQQTMEYLFIQNRELVDLFMGMEL